MLGKGFALFVLAGTSYAAYLDLKTSEVPDRVSIAVAGVSVLYYAYRSWMSGSPDPLVASLAAGTSLFLLGWAMYMAGMWGGADAFVLGAVGYAFPVLPAGFSPPYAAPWPVPLSLLLTVFLVGAVYSVSYAVYAAARSRGFAGRFREELEDHRRWYSIIVVLYTALAGLGTLAVYTVFRPSALAVARNFAASLVLLALLLGLTAFLKTVESRVMEREIPVERLEEGDVLAEEIELEASRDDAAEELTDRLVERFRSKVPFSLPYPGNGDKGRIAGLTPEQVEEVKGKREEVRVRTGVRFIPSFPLAILVLLYFGDPVFFAAAQAL